MVSLKPRVSTGKEVGWFHSTRPPSQSNTLGLIEIHLASFSVWFQYDSIETILVSKRYFGLKIAKSEVSIKLY